MARKRHTAEEIVAKLRQVDVLMAQGRQVADAVRAIGVTEVRPSARHTRFAIDSTLRGAPGLDRHRRSQDRLHRAGQSVGEWLLRELQRKAAR